jgi:transcription antitermination protein NusB
MANRHLARSVVLQTLYEWDFNNGELKYDISSALERNTNEFAPGGTADGYMDGLLGGVLRTREKLDEIITKAAPEWPIEKIAVVDRNILRIGLYELLFGDTANVPPKVAINEAIELAKTFGGESSGRFVNGVLGSVYRELGEPGKDQAPKTKIKDVPYEEMHIERLAGAILFCRSDEGVKLGLVHDVFGHWTLVKEDLKEEEDYLAALNRCLLQKLGVDECTVIAELAENEYIAHDPETGKTRKQVKYFLVEVKDAPIGIVEAKGLTEAGWFPLKDIAGLNFYDDVLPIITKGVEKLGTLDKVPA